MKIYERIMQIRSGRWEIGVIEDHQARPLTEEEMQEAINKLNAVPSAPVQPAGSLREDVRSLIDRARYLLGSGANSQLRSEMIADWMRSAWEILDHPPAREEAVRAEP